MKKNKSSKIALGAVTSDAPGTFNKALTVATRIGLHPKTLHRWAAKGLIRRYKINDRVVLFNEAEVERFIQDACSSTKGGYRK